MSYKKSARTRADIIRAAERLFIERGYYATGIKDIAAEAGIVHTSVYYYFKNKEAIARAVFDVFAGQIEEEVRRVHEERRDLLFKSVFGYVLIFKHLALNPATKAVYYDLVDYADYDEANIQRLERTVFKDLRAFFEANGRRMSDSELVAFMLTSDAFAKALFKGMGNGILRMTMEEAIDYFCRRMLVSDGLVTEEAYRRTFDEALRLSAAVTIDGLPSED